MEINLTMTNPKVSVVVLSWNAVEKTLDCLNSILQTDYENFEIILVDNGSQIETVDKLKEIYKNNDKIKLIFNEKNLGPAVGRNVGFRNSSENAKYIAFFDNDTIIPKEYIGQLVDVMEKEDKIMGVNGAFSDFSEGYPNKNTTLTLVSFDAPYYDDKLKGISVREAVALTGSGCMYDKKFIASNPFYGAYFFGGEEVYLGLLVYLRGGKCAKVLHAPYQHLSQNSFQGTKSPLASYHATKNRLMSLYLFFDRKTLFKLSPLIFLSQLVYFLYSPRLMVSKLNAYSWLVKNYWKLKKKKLQEERIVEDKEIIKYMSGKFQDPNIVQDKFSKKLLSGMNKLFLAYCKLVKLRTVEMTI
ncbi:glycosyltransferase family 2 protein [archaeon]|nr:glycosyltransferase family 2 protein [archaeon]